MPSPFPGMDPYLEEPNLWPDVHSTLIIEMKGHLNELLPRNYQATVDKYVWIHEPDAESRTRLVKPDVRVSQFGAQPAVPNQPASVMTAPATIVLPAIRREGSKYLKIADLNTQRLVTVIELLSPSNKSAGPDRDAYLTKRIDYLTAGVNLIEIDLLRAGGRLPLGDVDAREFDYYVMVCRPAQMPSAGFWSFTVRDHFPDFPIPLAPTESDVAFNLRPCLDRTYQISKYEMNVDYHQPAVPPLSPVDAEWARTLTAV